MIAIKKLIINCLILVLIAGLAFLIHFLINNSMGKPVELNQLVYSYGINAFLACSIITTLFLLKKKFKDQLGFVFMAGSLFKFVFFFLLFYPQYNSDDDLSRLEFSIFFIPYVICLITEIIILSKFLNGLDNYK